MRHIRHLLYPDFKPELPHFPTAPQSQSEHIEDGGEPAPENNVGEGMETTSNSDTEPPEEESQLIEEPDAGNVQSEPSPHDSEVGAASGGKDESGELPSANKEDAGAVTEPDTENQEAPLNGVVTDLGGVGEEDARYKIETLEARVGSLPCTVYVRYCKRDPFSGDWEVVKEKGTLITAWMRSLTQMQTRLLMWPSSISMTGVSHAANDAGIAGMETASSKQGSSGNFSAEAGSTRQRN